LPLTVLEAFAVGRAVVVSDVPGLSDVVTPEVGARVAPCDQRQLAEALACRLHQPTLVRMEGAAAARHAERFDLRVTLDNLAAETLALARNGRRRPSECYPELPVRP